MSTHKIARKSIPLSDFSSHRSPFRGEELFRAIPEQNAAPDTESLGPGRSLLPDSNDGHGNHRELVKGRVYWLYPTSMGISLLAGLILAVGHHFFYRWLDGQIVGSTSKQQWSLRIGNGFAILVSSLLKIAVGIASTQYLWRSLQRTSVSLDTINGAFSLQTNLFSFLNWELLSRIRIVVVLAVIFWCLPLTAVIAPAALSVTRSQVTGFSILQVPNIGISNKTLEPNFITHQRADTPATGTTPRLARVVGAVAMSGQPQSLQAPNAGTNISYNLQSYVPLLKCGSANATTKLKLIEMLLSVTNTSTIRTPWGAGFRPKTLNNETFHWNATGSKDGSPTFYGDIGYFGEVSIRAVNNTYSPWWNSSQVDGLQLQALSGEVLIAIPEANPNITKPSLMEFISCQIYNASLTINVNFINNISSVRIVESKWVNDVDIHTLWALGGENGQGLMSYFAYLRELGSYIIGAVSWYQNSNVAGYISRNTEVLNSYMGTSAQVYYMDQKIGNLSKIVDQVSMDQTSATAQLRNISFSQDLEEFSLNSTLSLLSDDLFCNTVTVNATTSSNETVYLYEPKNLIIVYSSVLFASFLSAILGSFAFFSNGVGYDANVSTFATTMQSQEVKEILKTDLRNIQPLENRLGRLKLRFSGSEGFVRDEFNGSRR